MIRNLAYLSFAISFDEDTDFLYSVDTDRFGHADSNPCRHIHEYKNISLHVFVPTLGSQDTLIVLYAEGNSELKEVREYAETSDCVSG